MSEGPGRGRGSLSPEIPFSGFSSSTTPNIPLTLPRWGGPPPPPLPHHPHSFTSAWANNHNHSNSRSRRDSDIGGGGGSISLAKITQPPAGSGHSSSTTSDFYRRNSDEHTLNDLGYRIGSSTIQNYDQQRGSGHKYERDVSEDPSIGVGQGGNGGGSKRRRRESEKPSLEEMDDRWVVVWLKMMGLELMAKTAGYHLCTLPYEKD
jgi:hypothetical protein